MSHIVQIQTQVRDSVAVAAACSRLQLPAPEQRRVRLFSGEVTGLAVLLPTWRYPLVCQTDTGQLHYDNYGGRWGADSELHRFLQAYAVEKTKQEARRAGQATLEQRLPDGSIRVQIAVS